MQLSALPAHLNSTQELNARGAFFFFLLKLCRELLLLMIFQAFFPRVNGAKKKKTICNRTEKHETKKRKQQSDKNET